MARAAQADKMPAVARANRVDDERRVAEAPAAMRSIPLNLAPLLTPYKKQGRLSLRIERLPRGARLSRGCRNNDGASWSLASDELEDLAYQLPEGCDGEHSLAVRIISLAGGNTLAVLDFVVSPGADEAAPSDSIEEPRDDTDLHRLRDELATSKAALAARDSELAETIASTRDTEAELATARAAWSAELDERLAAAAVQAASHLQACRGAWESEQNALLAKLETHSREQLAEARERWQRETQDALLKAENAWKADEAARLAATAGQWQEKLTALQATLAERETASARAIEAAEQARVRWQQETQDALLKAEHEWKADEASRLAAAEARWREAPADAPSGAVDDHELRSLREQLSALQVTLAERETALTRAEERWQREAQEALSTAEQAWKAEETARLAAAETQWREALPPAQPGVVDDRELRGLREKSAGLELALAEATARRESAEAALERARVRAREEMAAVKATLAMRDAELAQARSASAPSRGHPEPRGVAQPSRIRELINRPDERGTQDQRTFIREIIVAVALGVAGVMFYPNIEALIFGEPPVAVRTIPVPRAKPAPPVVVAQRTAVVARDAKLRAEPSATAAVVASLKQGLSVAVVEERGKWVLVRADGKTGWLKSSLLKDITPPAAPAP